MNTKLGLVALAACCIASSAVAQTSTPVADALRATAKRSATNLVAGAEEMPAGKYGFKPTPAQMSFGEVIGHLGGGNMFLCSTISGVPAPKSAELAKNATKDQLVARLKESFQFCETSLAKLDDSKLGEKVKFFGSEMSRAGVILATAADWADHYSQMAIYLRLNGLLPPTAKGKAQE
jgi:DinB family protein